MENRPKILIVDDEPFNVDYLEQELEDLEYNTVTAYNGKEALEQVAAESPDLVLLDIQMPIMDGFQVLSRLKANPNTRDIPVIVISAMSDMNSVVKGISIGAEDYLPKPFDPVLLKARISSSLEKKVWRDREKLYLQQIQAEKQRVDELLHVILPEEVITELKATNQVSPRLFPNVAVMFTDIVGFTPYCDSHTPQEVATSLQLLVEQYEQLALKYELQKIKTIGDAFMAAGGLLRPLSNPVLNCVQCGLEMTQIVRQLPANWRVRVGIHFGSVMAGIVGHRQYLYDIWGDTVNTAARIESQGTPDCVNLSPAAWEQVTNYFSAESSGIMTIKGKGEMELFRVVPTA